MSDTAPDGLRANTEGYECFECGAEYDYSYNGNGKTIDVSGLNITSICPTIDSGAVIHVEGDEQ